MMLLRAMPKAKDTNKIASKQVAKITKITPPKGEDLLGSEELKRQFRKAKTDIGCR